MLKKNMIYAVLCLCVVFVLSGCGKDEKDDKPVDITSAPVYVGNGGDSVTITPEATVKPSVVPLESMEVTIYTLNTDSLEKEAVPVLVTIEDQLTPELIIEQVVDAMEGEGFYIGINDIIKEQDSVRIDFRSDAVPVIDVGASVEGSIIDILAQSVLDNLPQYKKIFISIEGGPYHSGHLEFELDDVYLGR